MKKFYLFSMILMGYATTITAQTCPVVLAQYFSVPATPGYCKLFLGGGPGATPADTAIISLIQPAGAPFFGQPIPDLNGKFFTKLSNTGGATVEYNCALYTIDHIEMEYNVGGVHMKCSYSVGAGGSLPIKLSAFNGRLNTETEATLAWTSSLEENSFQYEVQRSADGKNFVTVGKIKASGTSLEAVKYTFNDPLPANGTYFYRLNMIDIDGKSEYSKVVYVNSKKGAGIVTKIFPNPFTSEVQLIGATSADLNTPGNINIFSISGQLINFRIVGANAIAIDPNAPKGLYLLKFKSGADQKVYKLVKN